MRLCNRPQTMCTCAVSDNGLDGQQTSKLQRWISSTVCKSYRMLPNCFVSVSDSRCIRSAHACANVSKLSDLADMRGSMLKRPDRGIFNRKVEPNLIGVTEGDRDWRCSARAAAI